MQLPLASPKINQPISMVTKRTIIAKANLTSLVKVKALLVAVDETHNNLQQIRHSTNNFEFSRETNSANMQYRRTKNSRKTGSSLFILISSVPAQQNINKN